MRVYGRQQCWQWHNAADNNFKETHTQKHNTNKGSLDPSASLKHCMTIQLHHTHQKIKKSQPEFEQGKTVSKISVKISTMKAATKPLPMSRQGWAERIWCWAKFILLLFKVYLLSPSKIQDYFIISSEKLSEDQVYFIAMDVCTSAKTLSPLSDMDVRLYPSQLKNLFSSPSRCWDLSLLKNAVVYLLPGNIYVYISI